MTMKAKEVKFKAKTKIEKSTIKIPFRNLMNILFKGILLNVSEIKATHFTPPIDVFTKRRRMKILYDKRKQSWSRGQFVPKYIIYIENT